MNDKKTVRETVKEYSTITLAVMIMCVGIYFFKFPNHFAFGGVSGLATVLSAMTGMTPSTFTNVANYTLLAIGFIFLGRSVGIRTVYATVVMSACLALLERFVTLEGPLTSEPLLELIFAIACPALGSAMLFNIQASSGGTDIIAMILKKHTSFQIGTALLLVDLASVILSFFVFGASTGLYSVLGLVGKSLGIDTLIESMNLSKCFTIICDDPDEICGFIINELKRSATVYKAEGACTHQPKTVILADMKPSQAVQLRSFIRNTQKDVFMQITNSSEIIGRGRGITQG